MPATVISGGASIAKGILGSNAGNEAAQLYQQAGQNAQNINQQVYQTNEGNLNPYINMGTQAQTALQNLEGLNGTGAESKQANAYNDFLNSTNYQFQLGQGENAIKYAGAPALNSSATAKSLNNYAQSTAQGALGSYLGLLGNQGSQGLSAAGTLGSLGQQYANTTNANLFGAAGGQAQGIGYSAGALGNMATGLGSALTGTPAQGTPGSVNYNAGSPGIFGQGGVGTGILNGIGSGIQSVFNAFGG